MGFVVIARHRVAARRRSAIKGAGRHRSQFDAWSLPARRAPCCQRRTHPAPKSRRGPALADNAGCERITGCSSGCRATYSSLLDFTERDVSMGKVNIKTLAESDQELLDGPMIYSPIGWCPISKTRLTGSGSPPTTSSDRQSRHPERSFCRAIGAAKWAYSREGYTEYRPGYYGCWRDTSVAVCSANLVTGRVRQCGHSLLYESPEKL